MNKLHSEASDKINSNDITGIINAGKASYEKSLKEEPREVKPEGIEERKITGVVIGTVASVSDDGRICVDLHLKPGSAAIPAAALCEIKKEDVGREVAIMFQNGDLMRPAIIGPVIRDESPDGRETEDLRAHKKTITLTAEEDIVFQCGKASITLTKAGKIIIRGKYILSRSSGVNSIKGGSVEIN